MASLTDTAKETRKSIVRMVYESGASHVGSSLSCADILVSIYAVARIDPAHPEDPGRDRVILSKGHAAAALYAVLAEHGFFPKSRLDAYCRDGSPLTGHPDIGCVPGVETSTGSLGHGLSIGVGMALASRIAATPYRVFVVLGDGECDEGSVWEAALLAAHHRLDNLVIVVDKNNQQGLGRTDGIVRLDHLDEKFRSFGWQAVVVDGHDCDALSETLRAPTDRPLAIIADTVKGKGVGYMEDQVLWHYRNPNKEQYEEAVRDIESGR